MNPASRDRIASGLADTLMNVLGYHREGCDCGCQGKRAASPDNAAFFDAYLKGIDKWTRKLQTLLADIWGQERAIVIANLKRLKGRAQGAKAPNGLIDSILYPKRKFVDLLSAASKDLFTALVLAEGERAMDTLGVDVAFDVTNPHVQKWLEDYTIKLSKNLEAVNEETLRAVLSEGMDAGETIPELMARVNDTFETWNRDRAEVIARTETIRASNEATMESYRQSGVVTKKAWLASPESCEICLALEGEEPLALEDAFFDDGYSDGQAPPRHPNCTCAVVAHFDD